MDQHDWRYLLGKEETKMRLEIQGSYNNSNNNDHTHSFSVSVLYFGLNTLRIKGLESTLPGFESYSVT